MSIQPKRILSREQIEHIPLCMTEIDLLQLRERATAILHGYSSLKDLRTLLKEAGDKDLSPVMLYNRFNPVFSSIHRHAFYNESACFAAHKALRKLVLDAQNQTQATMPELKDVKSVQPVPSKRNGR